MKKKNPTQKRKQIKVQSPKKKVSEHLLELRYRLLVCLFFFIIFSIISYVNHNELIAFLLKPFNGPIYITSPAGGLSLTINISLLFGFLLSLPVIIYQLFAFLSPAFSKQSKKGLILSAVSSSVLMITGVAFGYYICLPAAFTFLAKFGTNDVRMLVGSNEYFSFVSRYLLGFGLVFQLPIILISINYMHPLSIRFLLKISPYIILSSFIVSAILTPTPDLVNQVVMAVPILFLYYFSVFIIVITKYKKTRVNNHY